MQASLVKYTISMVKLNTWLMKLASDFDAICVCNAELLSAISLKFIFPHSSQSLFIVGFEIKCDLNYFLKEQKLKQINESFFSIER